MARVAPNLPAETDLLCEGCGYTLNGLPEGANCPECGRPVDLSVSPTVRQPPEWEQPGQPVLRSFLGTSAMVIFHPTRFFRGMTTRDNLHHAAKFAHLHIAIASALFAASALLHEEWYMVFGDDRTIRVLSTIGLFIMLFIATGVSMMFTTRVAARLSAWEAAYRGIRLPRAVVMRGLYYHTAHYLPVGLIALITVAAYQLLFWYRPLFWSIHLAAYLYILSGEVVIGAGYLFNTYWIGMRNMMYANY